ncbi:MAG: 5'-methylthioadenosine/adenosylhomocysteine nucleosidase [Candidatus Izemoplasmataceae bacterium]
MNIGIIFAMQEELDAFLALIKNTESETFNAITFFKGTIDDHQIIMTLSGIGKVQASFATTRMLSLYDIDMIFNSGVAGGININIQSLVISSGLLYHDVDVTAFNYELGQIPNQSLILKADDLLVSLAENKARLLNLDYKIGLIASGDQFVTTMSQIKPFVERFDDLFAVEMEATAIAHVAYLFDKPFLAIRSISDQIGQSSQADDFLSFIKNAALNAATLLYQVIKAL